MTTERYETRIVRKEELREGYKTFVRGIIMSHAYEVIHEITEGPNKGHFLVEKPRVEKLQ